MNQILWQPTESARRQTRLHAFQRYVREQWGGPSSDDYHDLHRWSVAYPGAFWSAVWSFGEVIGEPGVIGDSAYVRGGHMTEARWFPEARLNFAENLLRPSQCGDPSFGQQVALKYLSEAGDEQTLTRTELLNGSQAFAGFLSQRGVVAGDRVAAVVSNIPEAIIAFLGCAAIGAVWSSCSPDFGQDAICDRFGQIEPTVFLSVMETCYGGKKYDLRSKAQEVLGRLPSVRTAIAIGVHEPPSPWIGWDRAIEAGFHATRFEPFPWFPFDHPLAILYSSGTTGAPKCLLHGVGGTLLQHLKEHQLHCDLRPGDRLFYYTTTGWMMWNWLLSGLASGATLILYDGSPFHPHPGILWDMAERFAVTHFGTSAKYLAHLEKLGIKPCQMHPLSPLRCILSTGSPLLPESFDYVYRDVKQDVHLASISGGTDIISCFVLGCPIQPVYRGEIQVKGLGMDVQILNADGQRVLGEPGELVCAAPFPSMPVSFWNDPEKALYLASYFDTYPNVWRHGDWAEETPHGGFIIHGRSDATLKPGGVRIGTAEIYQQVETFPEILDALATALRRDGDEKIILFVRMKPGFTLDNSLIRTLQDKIRSHCSPRHVPAYVIEAPDLPRTINGKISEIAVRNAINGVPVKNTAALANPEALEFFHNLKL